MKKVDKFFEYLDRCINPENSFKDKISADFYKIYKPAKKLSKELAKEMSKLC